MTPTTPEASVPHLQSPLCELLGVRHPIALGGMASGTAAELVAAVSNAGGLGILGASGRSPAEIGAQTACIRELTAAPFGLNVLLFYHDETTVEAVLAQRPAVASFAWPTADEALAEVFARAVGDAEHTPLLFGQDAGLINTIEPAGDIIARIVREAHAVITERLAQLAGFPAPT